MPLGVSMMEVLRDHQIADLWRRSQESGQLTFTTIEIGTRNIYLQGIATSLGDELPGNTLLLVPKLDPSEAVGDRAPGLYQQYIA